MTWQVVMQLREVQSRTTHAQIVTDALHPGKAAPATLKIARRPGCCDPWLPLGIAVHKGGAARIDACGGSTELLGTDSASRVRALAHMPLQLFDHGFGLVRKGWPKTSQNLAVGKVVGGG